MPSPIVREGGSIPGGQARFVALVTRRFNTGLVTQRSPFLDAGNGAQTRYYDEMLGSERDMLIAGANVELSNRNTLIRRPGFTAYCSQLLGGKPLGFYSWKQLSGTITILADTTTGVYVVTPTSADLLFAKSAGSGITTFCGVGAQLYMADGVDAYKWNGRYLQNPNFVQGGVGWTPQAGWVIAAGAGYSGSGYLATYAGLGTAAIVNNQRIPCGPGAVISAKCMVEGTPTATGNAAIRINFYNSAGTSLATNTGNAATANIGWNQSLVSGTAPAGTTSASIDFAVFSETAGAWSVGGFSITSQTVSNIGVVAPSTAPTLSFGSGSANIKANWSYVTCFQSTSDGSVSSASPPSAFTGPLSSASVTVQSSFSPDPQVTTVQLYRTADGGAYYYLLASFANVVGTGTWSFTDTLPDSSLNLFLQAPLNGTSNPFPAGGTNLAYSAGRLWCSVNGTLYFAGGPDITNGNGQTAWPALNYFVFATTIVKITPSGGALAVQTTDDLQSILGTDIVTFYPQLVLNNFGLRSYHALAENASDLYMFTSDRQFTQLSAGSGIGYVGFGIGDIMQAIDPMQCYVEYLIQGYDYGVYVCDPANGVIYRLNPMQPPAGNAVWSTPYYVTGGCTCIGKVETSPGNHTLLVGRSDGSILMRNVSAFGDTPISATPATAALVPYAQCHATIGNVVLASPGQLAEVQSISTEVKGVGQLPTISVLADEISGTFEVLPNPVPDPPQLVPSTTILSNRYYLDQAQRPVVMRNIQVDIAFQSEVAANELYSYTLYAAIHLE